MTSVWLKFQHTAPPRGMHSYSACLCVLARASAYVCRVYIGVSGLRAYMLAYVTVNVNVFMCMLACVCVCDACIGVSMHVCILVCAFV